MARRRNVFDPTSTKPFDLSRTKIELFVQCPRCFYLDRRKGIGRPAFPPFTLNSAVDLLFKKEFDIHRSEGTSHSLMTEYGIEAVPYQHDKLNEWRDNFKGIRYCHLPTNFVVFGAVDDVWVKPDRSLIIVDYKSTSTDNEVSLNDKWKDSYKRQMEIYQWLFRKNGFSVDKTGYFVYANALRNKEAFHKKLEFEIILLPHDGDDSWVEDKLIEARKCLCSEQPPAPADDCEWCAYGREAGLTFLR